MYKIKITTTLRYTALATLTATIVYTIAHIIAFRSLPTDALLSCVIDLFGYNTIILAILLYHILQASWTNAMYTYAMFAASFMILPHTGYIGNILLPYHEKYQWLAIIILAYALVGFTMPITLKYFRKIRKITETDEYIHEIPKETFVHTSISSPSAPILSQPSQKQSAPSRKTQKYATEYAFPSVQLLHNTTEQNYYEDTHEKQIKLHQILQDFGVNCEITGTRTGPVITLYEIKTAPGVKAQRVIGLAGDIARNMSAMSARVTDIPGKNVLGIELPNETRHTVYLRSLLESTQYQETHSALPIILGDDISGEPVIVDLSDMPHMLIAGSTGSGKSVGINSMILALLYKLTPQQCQFIMIDPKMLELIVYNDIPHLLTPVVTDPKKAILALKWAVNEMERRYIEMSKIGVRNIEGYNAKIRKMQTTTTTQTRKVQIGFDEETSLPIHQEEEINIEELPYIVVVVDEMADLMLVAGKEIEIMVQRLAQMARAAGIHLIMATQRPSVNVITGTIKANFPSRVSFHVSSKFDSTTIIGKQGAEQLLRKGDMLYLSSGGKMIRVHAPFVSDEEVEAIVTTLKQNKRVSPIISLELNQEQSSRDEEFIDALYAEAIETVRREKKASASFLQRKFQIGYNRAARMIEQMEADGIVSSATSVGKREIL